MNAGDRILVYEHRARESGGVGLRVMTRAQLDYELACYPHLQVTWKPTYRRSTVDVYQYDLYTDSQKERYQCTPNFYTNIATVGIGYFRGLYYTELIILSANKD